MPDQYPTLKFEVDFEEDPSPGFKDVALAWSPLAYWRLDEPSGTNANDSGDNNLDGTYTGGVTLNQTSILADGNACASFDGTDDWVSVAYTTTFKNLVPPWTLAAWIFPTASRTGDANQCAILTYENTGGPIPFALAYGQEDAMFVGDSCISVGYLVTATPAGWHTVADPNPVRLSEWQHYIGVASVVGADTYLSLYRNGIRVAGPALQSRAAEVGDVSLTTRIGRRWDASGSGQFFPGRIDEPVIFNRALDEVEAAKLYASSFSTLTKTNYTTLQPIPGSASRVRAFSSSRGRQDSVGRIEAGQATVILDNRDDLLSPDPLVNLVQNPSFEEDVTSHWSVTNAARARSVVRQQFGAASCQLTSSGAGEAYLHAPASSGLRIGLRPGRTYTFSAYMFLLTGEGITTGESFIRIRDNDGSTTQTTTGTTPGGLDAWHRITATRTIRTNAVHAWVEIGWTAGAANEDLWLDGLQVEEAAAVTTYADGEQTDCRWNGQKHLSASHRKASGSFRNILPMRVARLSCDYNPGGGSVNHKIIEGPIVSMSYEYPDKGKDSTVTLQMVDGMAALSSGRLAGFTRPTEETVTRIPAILKAGGIPSAKVAVDSASIDTRDLRAIAGGSESDVSPLDLIRQVEDTELGLFFIKGDGTHFYHGGAYRDITDREELVLSDSGPSPGFPSTEYSGVGISYDEQNIVNDITITNEQTGWIADIVRPDPIRRYWPRSTTAVSLFQDPVALSRPRFEAIPRVEPIEIQPVKNPGTLWPAMLGLEISDLVRVQRTGTRDVLRDYLQWVEGIEHNCQPGDWRMRLHTSSEIVTGSPAIAVVASGMSEPALVHAGSSGFDGGGYSAFTLPGSTYTGGHLYCLLVWANRNTAPVPSPQTIAGMPGSPTEIRTDTGTTGSFRYRLTCFVAQPTSTSFNIPDINTSGDLPFTLEWALVEIAYGFDAADPIGVSNFASGSGTSGSLDVGTLDSVYSRVLTQVFNTGGGAATWGRFFELHERAGGGAAYAVAKGPEGTDTAVVTYGAGEAWQQQAFEVKAQ